MIEAYRQLRTARVVGLISGTSADAIDAALVQIEGSSMKLLRFHSHPFPAEVRQLLFDLFEDRATVRQVARAHFVLGELFAEAALAVMQGESVDLIASHGQTVAHLPYDDPPSTLQLGEASILAERTQTLTVSDFRPADLALGGQAAPLVPFFDAWLLRNPQIDRVALNLGGMANLTWIPRQGDKPVLGWDTGPANVVMDALAERFSGLPADLGGQMAAQGKVVPEILQQMLAHPYFHAQGPRSTGRELFGRDWISPFLEQAAPADLMRTAVALTAETVVASLKTLVQAPFDLVVGGGGLHNPILMDELKQRLQDLPLHRLSTFDEFGISADSREACAFALLGHETVWGRASSVPSVTGARRAAILGRITFPTPA